jgi:D-alanyl-D-alanine dipeptidase
MEALGLVDVARVDSTIVVELVYATADNFVGEVLYEDISRAFLDPEAAEALVRAQRILAERRPGLRLIVYDAARPMSVQARMHDMVAGTEKHIYVSDPAKGGGLHNYGLAVDVSIVDGDGVALDMGTAFDHLGFEANIDREGELVARGIISEAARRNRVLLREVMGAAGYMALRSEWWHFNFRSRAVAVEGYLVIE